MNGSSSKRRPGLFGVFQSQKKNNGRDLQPEAPGVLTEFQQNVFHFCAIFYEPVSEMELLKALQHSNVLDESGHGVTFRTLNEALSVLRSRGWLPHSGSVVCDEKRSEEAIVNASQSPNFKLFIQSVRAIRPLSKYRNWYSNDLQRNIREIRLSIFEPNPQEFYQLLRRTEQEYRHQFEKDGVLA